MYTGEKSHMLELHSYTGLFTRLLCVSFNIQLFTQMTQSSNCRQSLQTVVPMLHFLVTSVTDQLQMETHPPLQSKKYVFENDPYILITAVEVIMQMQQLHTNT